MRTFPYKITSFTVIAVGAATALIALGVVLIVGGTIDQSVARNQRAREKSDTLLVSLAVPIHTARHIYGWARKQSWPTRTKLEPLRAYHVTLLYAPTGYAEYRNARWNRPLEKAEVKVKRIDAFPAREKGYAYVLVLDAPKVKRHGEDLQAKAEMHGLQIQHFAGGYQPHITLAYGPSRRLSGIDAPAFHFNVGPSSVSSP